MLLSFAHCVISFVICLSLIYHSLSSFDNEWYIDNKCITKEITQWAEENNIDLNNLSDIDIGLIKITFT